MSFTSLSNSQTDLLNINTPILNTPAFNRVALEYKHPETGEPMTRFSKSDLLKQMIVANSSLYTLIPSLDHIYLCEFPSKYSTFPNLIFRKENQFGILMNIEHTSMVYHAKEMEFACSDYKMLTTNILNGSYKISASILDNITLLENIYFGFCFFLYNLFIRSYMSDFDIRSLPNKSIMYIFFCFAKMIANSYMLPEGSDPNDDALSATRKFFDNNVDFNNLPLNNEIYTYNNIFKLLASMNIMQGVTVPDFKNKIVEKFGEPVILGLVNGLDFTAMLGSANMGSIFSDRIIGVSPKGIKLIADSLKVFNKEVFEEFEKTKETKNEDYDLEK
jgi:hypothetical protein